jgi:hypothetical protein
MGKPNKKKLSLNKQTVRVLAADALKQVGGGGATSIAPSICLVGSCAPILFP